MPLKLLFPLEWSWHTVVAGAPESVTAAPALNATAVAAAAAPLAPRRSPLDGFALLGLGDIALPCLWLAYCRKCDLYMRGGRPSRWQRTCSLPADSYFARAVAGYMAGLLCTLLALTLMQVAQPALLYLVPCTLLPPLALAVARGQTRDVWTGEAVAHGDAAATEKRDVVPDEEMGAVQ